MVVPVLVAFSFCLPPDWLSSSSLRRQLSKLKPPCSCSAVGKASPKVFCVRRKSLILSVATGKSLG
ncbi:hypothetical protein P3T76_000656 [Phytophthora citrophthora]|uniref:Uncharacterized protein n=1 Tax=Phytophthora citrophthora TaxID=4793 RepID=A0AAD9LTS0_9STRA|nr:hypothetical protein P3T76_000656 [Phytophthora citrophthora]